MAQRFVGQRYEGAIDYQRSGYGFFQPNPAGIGMAGKRRVFEVDVLEGHTDLAGVF